MRVYFYFKKEKEKQFWSSEYFTWKVKDLVESYFLFYFFCIWSCHFSVMVAVVCLYVSNLGPICLLPLHFCLQFIILPAFSKFHFSIATERQVQDSGIIVREKRKLCLTHRKTCFSRKSICSRSDGQCLFTNRRQWSGSTPPEGNYQPLVRETNCSSAVFIFRLNVPFFFL